MRMLAFFLKKKIGNVRAFARAIVPVCVCDRVCVRARVVYVALLQMLIFYAFYFFVSFCSRGH